MSDRSRYQPTDNKNWCRMFVGHLCPHTTEESLKSYFENWGEVTECKIIKDQISNESKEFGFITFKHAKCLDDAQSARPHTIDDKQVTTRRANHYDKNKAKVYKMFIGGVDGNTTEDDIKQTFSPYGDIEEVEMPKDRRTGEQKHFCFVTFDDYDSVDKCVIQKYFNVAGLSVRVQKAKTENDLPGNGSEGRQGGYKDGYTDNNSSNYNRRDQGGWGGGHGGGGGGGGHGGGRSSSNYHNRDQGYGGSGGGSGGHSSNYHRDEGWGGGGSGGGGGGHTRSNYHHRDQGWGSSSSSHTSSNYNNRDQNWSGSGHNYSSSYHSRDQGRGGDQANSSYHRERGLGRGRSSYSNSNKGVVRTKRNYYDSSTSSHGRDRKWEE